MMFIHINNIKIAYVVGTHSSLFVLYIIKCIPAYVVSLLSVSEDHIESEAYILA